MNALTYFVPRLGAGITTAQIAAAGLSYAYREPVEKRECTNGPGDQPGVLLAFAPTTSPIEYDTQRQRWRRIQPGAGEPSSDGSSGADAWVGACCDQPIRSSDFARPSLLPGHPVELAAGGEWIVPVARGLMASEDSLSWHVALPTVVGLDDAGNWTTGGVVPKYAKLWETAGRFWDALQSELQASGDNDEPVTLQFDELQDDAVKALQANYAIGPVEVALLGLFDSMAAQRILQALVDWPTYLGFIKKKLESASSNSTAGLAADTPAIDPA